MFEIFFFFNDAATTEIYTLSLHDALPISNFHFPAGNARAGFFAQPRFEGTQDRKSTRLNSSHITISYAVFCLKKKNKSTDRSIRLNLIARQRHVWCQSTSYFLSHNQ